MLFVLKDKDRHNKPLLQGFFAKRFGFVLIRQGLRSMPTHKPEVPANEIGVFIGFIAVGLSGIGCSSHFQGRFLRL